MTKQLEQVNEQGIHHITTIGAGRQRRADAVVRCPRRHAVDPAICQGCDLWRGSAGCSLLCASTPAGNVGGPGSVSALMSRDVICILADLDVGSVAWLLSSKHIGGLPVVDEQRRPHGMITKSDLLRALGEGRLDGAPFDAFDAFDAFDPTDDAPPTAWTAAALMSPAVTVSVWDDIEIAARLFLDKGFRSAPVVDDQDRLVGVISTLDLLRGLPALAKR